MGKLHIQDSINEQQAPPKKEEFKMNENQAAPKPPVPPAPKASNLGQDVRVQREEAPMQTSEGIIIDLGEGLSLNVPIKKRMALQEFLRVAEKVKALEMLAEENHYGRNY